MASVPNTTTFDLATVRDVIFGAGSSGYGLSQCVMNARTSMWDPAYQGNKDNLLNFRNYGPGKTGLLTNLLGCYEFMETTGTTFYSRTGSNNLTGGGTLILNQDGKPSYSTSKAVGLNPGYASGASNIITSFPVSTALWFKNMYDVTYSSAQVWTNKTTNFYGVYQRHNSTNWTVSFANGGGVALTNIYTLASTVSPPVANTWYHVVMVATANRAVTLYVNGSAKTLTFKEGTGASTNFGAGVFNVGGAGGVGTYLYNGQTAVWNRALTSTNVTTLYKAGTGLAYLDW